MFETKEQHEELVTKMQDEISLKLNLKSNKIFYNTKSLRVKSKAFIRLKKVMEFFIIVLNIDSIKVKDLLKLSKQNNNLFYVDVKKSKIYTMDNDFYNWCQITGCTIESLRNLQ